MLVNPPSEQPCWTYTPRNTPSAMSREFLIHLFTITCGLLIALGLENAAEAMHHRHERKEAEEVIRAELTDNRDSLRKGKDALLQEMQQIKTTLLFVEARSAGDMVPVPAGVGVAFSESEIQDVAWRTASSTGVLAYMDYGEVGKFAGAYREQELLQTTEQRALNDFLLLSSFEHSATDINALSKERALELLPYLRHAMGDLIGIYAIGQGTLKTYDEALK